MKATWLLAAAAVVTEAVLVPNEPGSPAELAHTTGVCDHRVVNTNGTCSVFLDVPKQCGGATSACPLVLLYHGHGGHNSMYVHMQTSVHDYNFIGVYPQGANYNGKSGWNDGSFGPGCCNGADGGDQCKWDQFNCTVDPNDPDWTVTIIATITKMGATGRWYAYGSSNGANEAQILAANAVVHPDVLPLVGIAVHSGQMLASPARSAPDPYNYNQPCAGSQPCAAGGTSNGMAQLSIHGTADSVIAYHGGARFNSPTFILMDEVASDALWAKQNNCTGGVSNETVKATYQRGIETTATHSTWLGCPTKYPVELYTVLNSPHVGCRTIRGQDVFVTIFNFFAKVEVAHGGKPAPPPPPPSPPPPSPPTPPSPSPPSPSPPGPPEPAPPVACQRCLLKSCGFVRADHAKCTACIAQNRRGCASVCIPYPFAKSEEWLCGPSSPSSLV